MAGAVIDGAQSGPIISTVKHFALNEQETDRVVLDARIDPAAAREFDLLAFEIAIERGRPVSVMCAYNQVNGVYSCENEWLLSQVLKGDWRYPGFVMSDWGAVHSTVRSALAGLDQESGEQLDTENFFADGLLQAIADGKVPHARLDDMARQSDVDVRSWSLRQERRLGVCRFRGERPDRAGHRAGGLVLLRNEGLLPFPPRAEARCDRSSRGPRRPLRRRLFTGRPAGRNCDEGTGRKELSADFDPGAPLEAIRRQFPRAEVDYDDGSIPERAASAAAGADAAIVFVDQWMTETADAPDLSLPDGQDRLVEAVARANPRTAVVLETGGPVLMPWIGETAAVLEAWYPGQQGGEAIAAILSGDEDPSGRLPVTFPDRETQLPPPRIEGDPNGAPIGPVGRGRVLRQDLYRRLRRGRRGRLQWFLERGERPLFPFGFGLSYTTSPWTALRSASTGRGDGERDRAHSAAGQAPRRRSSTYRDPRARTFPFAGRASAESDPAPGEDRRANRTDSTRASL